jgi:hypothetical protein
MHRGLSSRTVPVLLLSVIPLIDRTNRTSIARFLMWDLRRPRDRGPPEPVFETVSGETCPLAGLVMIGGLTVCHGDCLAIPRIGVPVAAGMGLLDSQGGGSCPGGRFVHPVNNSASSAQATTETNPILMGTMYSGFFKYLPGTCFRCFPETSPYPWNQPGSVNKPPRPLYPIT